MSEQNNEMDNSFIEQDKKSPIGIIFLVLLLLLAGVFSVYYFIIDNPKTIFAITFSKVLNNSSILNDKSINYTLDIKGSSEKEDYKQIINVLNKMTFEGTIGNIGDSQVLNGIINYKNEKLLNYDLQIDGGEKPTIYAKSNDLFDKVIKIALDDDENSTYDTNTKDYEQVASSLFDTITASLKNAKYQKEITKLDNETVKKVTLKIDEAFLTNIYNKLLQDNNFLTSYAKVNNITMEEASNELNKAITDAKDNDESISLYVTLLKNEFLKFEYVGGEDNLTITKNNDKYDFDIVESYTLKYQGYIKINENNNKNNLELAVSLIKEQTDIGINLTYSAINNEELKLLDMTNIVNYEDLTEEEMNEIMTKLANNKAINNFITDLELLTEDNNILSSI